MESTSRTTHRTWAAFLCGLASLAVLSAGAAAAAPRPPAPPAPVTILDTLGSGTPATHFAIYGVGATVIGTGWLGGPGFMLSAPTVLTEFGAFVNVLSDACAGCAAAHPLLVQIRQSVNGTPGSSVIASFELPRDAQPADFSYLATRPNVVLGPGAYFAVFVPRSEEVDLLENVQLAGGGSYLPGYLQLALFSPESQQWSVENGLRAAIRILGVPLPVTKEECKGDGWQRFGRFENQGDCVSFIATHGRH